MSGKIKVVRWLFLLMVVLPICGLIYYFMEYSKDQYKSSFSFSVMSETPRSPLDFLSTTSASPDSHILADFIRSPKIVEAIDGRLDLVAMYRKGRYDPLYEIEDDISKEDLVDFWERMLNVFHDQASGILRVEVFAFSAEDAPAIANAIIDESRDLINTISNISEDDKLLHVSSERNAALESLRTSQNALANFRSQFQIVDPTANLQVQIELIKSLQEKYVDYIIELELMRDILSETDARVVQAKRKIKLIRENIELEKEKIGTPNATEQRDTESLVSIFDEYERLSLSVELDRERYSEGMRSYSTVLSETKIKDKYLAAHVPPNVPQVSQYPRRYLIFTLFTIAALLIWFSASLVYYSIRDRT